MGAAMRKLLLRGISALAVLILLVVLACHTRWASAYRDNNAAVNQLLVALQQFPLPPGSRLVYETSEVGGTFYPAGYAAMGESPNFLAYRVFVTELPPDKVILFFQPYSNRNPMDAGIFSLTKPPRYGSFPLQSITDHVYPSDREHAYVLYDFGSADELGLSDPRLW